MKSDKIAEIFIFEDSFFFSTRAGIKRVENERIILENKKLFNRFAVLGKRVYIKYSTFVLPSKVIGKNDEEIIISFPTLNPEKPVGDRRSARVRPSHVHPVKLYLKVNEEEREFELGDLSEGGFSIIMDNPSEIDNFLNREVEIHMDFPVEAEEVRGFAKLVNIQELEDGRVKLGFEMMLDDADSVKVRFYVYARIKEIIRG